MISQYVVHESVTRQTLIELSGIKQHALTRGSGWSARLAQQHPLQPTENSEKEPPFQPTGGDWRGLYCSNRSANNASSRIAIETVAVLELASPSLALKVKLSMSEESAND